VKAAAQLHGRNCLILYLKAAVLVAVDFGLKRKWRENNFEVLWDDVTISCTIHARKPIKETI
jgi:hypothetical protein